MLSKKEEVKCFLDAIATRLTELKKDLQLDEQKRETITQRAQEFLNLSKEEQVKCAGKWKPELKQYQTLLAEISAKYSNIGKELDLHKEFAGELEKYARKNDCLELLKQANTLH